LTLNRWEFLELKSQADGNFFLKISTVCGYCFGALKIMSKENVFGFLTEAAKDEQLKAQLKTAATPDELVDVGNQAGYKFSSEHVDEALSELKQKPGFFHELAEAIMRLFSPTHDDYPATGVQPFSGDPNH
jgi:predicted ribosomally synthesized peptide with nif11-like leader